MMVGLTGGIACGKSTVADILRALGATVIDADVVARQVVEPGSEALDAILAAFGPAVIAADGSLDRAMMGQIIIQNPADKQRLEAITHPRIRAAIANQAAEALAVGAESVFVEAALLVETGSATLYPHLWVVTCAPRTQLLRLASRNDFTLDDAQQWIDAQMPLHEKEAHATQVIRNDGTRAELQKQVRAAYTALMVLPQDPD